MRANVLTNKAEKIYTQPNDIRRTPTQRKHTNRPKPKFYPTTSAQSSGSTSTRCRRYPVPHRWPTISEGGELNAEDRAERAQKYPISGRFVPHFVPHLWQLTEQQRQNQYNLYLHAVFLRSKACAPCVRSDTHHRKNAPIFAKIRRLSAQFRTNSGTTTQNGLFKGGKIRQNSGKFGRAKR